MPVGSLSGRNYGIVVSLPSHQADFGVAPPEREALFRHYAWIANEATETTILVFQVAVWTESQATPDLFPPDHPEGLDGQKAMEKAALVAISVAEDFVSWMRVRGKQYWLGADESISNGGTADLIDLDSGKRIKNINWAYHMFLSNVGPPAGAETLDAIIELLGQGKTPDEAELLLADAQESMGRANNGTSLTGDGLEFDRRRVVLLSAIAAEVKIRQVIREKTPTDRRELVEVLLDNYREVDVAIGQLPHKPMKAAVGYSLHADDPDLFAKIQRLFKVRNDIAHRGADPDEEQARDAVRTAVELFAWLDELPVPNQ